MVRLSLRSVICLLAGVVCLVAAAYVPTVEQVARAQDKKAKVVADDPDKVTDPDYAYQGEYVGDVQTEEGKLRVGAQVIALGEGKFRIVGHKGGLPGDGWDKGDKHQIEGALADGKVVFKGDKVSATLQPGVILVTTTDGVDIGQLKKTARVSPTIGAKPPEGAVVLFDGSTADHFQGGRLTNDKLLMEGVTSKQKFGSCTVHLEFRLPYQPQDRGQGRGNSGCYLQGRYEVQILDSFGLVGKNDECGGIYTIKDPAVNMCFPPLVWQTYDIDYTAATYDDAGKKVKNGRMTVRHNGVVVQDNTELPNATRAAPVKEGPEPGPLYLQNHGNPVRFRNIWVVEKK